jgi:MFS family permease
MLKFFKENITMVGFGLLLTFFSGFGQTFLLSLYVPRISEEFNLSNSLFGSVYAMINLASAASLPFLGKLIDKYSLKRYSVIVFVFVSGSLILTSFSMHPVILFLGLWGIRLGGQGLLTHTAITTMARNFDHTRGKAISMATLGHPAGEALLPILVALIISNYGWRASLQVSAVLVLIILIPYALKVIPSANSYTGLNNEKRPEDVEKATWTQKQVLRSRYFRLIAPAVFILPMISTGLFFYQVALAEFKGWTAEWIALCFMCFAIASSTCMLIGGALVDRWTARNLFPFYLVPYLLGILILFSSDQPWIVPLYLTLLGITTGFGSTIKNAVMAELFGAASMGTVRSLFGTLMVLSSAVGPLFFGIMLDNGFGFNGLLLACVVMIGVVVILNFRVPSAYSKKKAYLKWKTRSVLQFKFK